MIISLTNKRYGITGTFDIDESCWNKHLSMHSKRPEEALQNNLSVCYGVNESVTREMIEKAIEDEYSMSCKLPEVIANAGRIACDSAD